MTVCVSTPTPSTYTRVRARSFTRRIDAANQAAHKSRCQFFAMLRQKTRVAIASHDQLAAVFNHLHDSVQKLFLSRLFVVEEFNIVDEQHVDVAKSLAE